MSLNIKSLLSNPAKINQIAKNSFDQYDKDKSGFLEYNEIYTVLSSFCESNSIVKPLEKDVKDTFDKLDLNKNGKIDFNEFKTLFVEFLKNQVH